MTNINSLIKKAELFEKLALYGGRRAFLSSLAQEVDMSTGLLPEYTGVSSAEDVESESWSGKSSLKIDPRIQQALNETLGLRLATDGVLGPQTVQAIQSFKNKYNNTKHFLDPELHKEIFAAAANKKSDAKSGLMREVPF